MFWAQISVRIASKYSGFWVKFKELNCRFNFFYFICLIPTRTLGQHFFTAWGSKIWNQACNLDLIRPVWCLVSKNIQHHSDELNIRFYWFNEPYYWEYFKDILFSFCNNYSSHEWQSQSGWWEMKQRDLLGLGQDAVDIPSQFDIKTNWRLGWHKTQFQPHATQPLSLIWLLPLLHLSLMDYDQQKAVQ